MAFFWRDELVANRTVDEQVLTQISHVLQARRETMPLQEAAGNPDTTYLSYIIRFDNKGYRVFDLAELLAYFHQAKYVERILFVLESASSMRANRQTGSFMELRLDHNDPNTSFLTVTADAADWVNASFAAVMDVLDNRKNRNGLVRGVWTNLVIQIVGLFVGFFISLWAASKISPKLTIDNAFLISFFLSLLIFGNFWGYINQRLQALVNATFPSIRFYRPSKDSKHWLFQAIVGGIILAVTLYVIDSLFSYAGRVLGSFLNSGG